MAVAGWPDPCYVSVNGIRLAYRERHDDPAVLPDAPPIIFLHGFPELGYSWRSQLGALAAAGFRAIAPDMRGYGDTSAPPEIESYDAAHLTADLVGLMDALEIRRAVFCGHDWGGFIAWTMPQAYPDRVAGVIGVNIPLMPKSPVPTIELLRTTRGEKNYMVQFQEPGVAEKVFNADPEKVFRFFYRKTWLTAEAFAALPEDSPQRNFELLGELEGEMKAGPWIVSEEDMKVFIDTFKRTGFTGGINWYRNLDRNWEATPDKPPTVSKPCLYVGAEDDVVLPPSMADGMAKVVPDLEKHVIKACGHFTQEEKPEELNAILVDWMKRRFGGEG